MLILGVIILIAAIASILYGNHLNTSFAVRFENIFENGEGATGTVWVVIGIILAVIAVAAIVFAIIKKKYYKF